MPKRRVKEQRLRREEQTTRSFYAPITDNETLSKEVEQSSSQESSMPWQCLCKSPKCVVASFMEAEGELELCTGAV